MAETARRALSKAPGNFKSPVDFGWFRVIKEFAVMISNVNELLDGLILFILMLVLGVGTVRPGPVDLALPELPDDQDLNRMNRGHVKMKQHSGINKPMEDKTKGGEFLIYYNPKAQKIQRTQCAQVK